MNWSLGYVSPFMMGMLVVLDQLDKHPPHTSGDWAGLCFLLLIICLVVGCAWYCTWIRPVSKSDPWWERY